MLAICLGNRFCAAVPRHIENYIIPAEDLSGLDTSVQNQVLQLQLELLRDIRRTVQPSSRAMYWTCIRNQHFKKMMSKSLPVAGAAVEHREFTVSL